MAIRATAIALLFMGCAGTAPANGPRSPLPGSPVEDDLDGDRVSYGDLSDAERAAIDRGDDPSLRTVVLVGVVVAPSKIDGGAWDGPGSASSEIGSAISAALLDQDPYAAVLRALSGPAIQALARPEPTGVAELWVGGYHVAYRALAQQLDTLTPTWQVRFEGVDLPHARLRVTLADADLAESDPIGAFDIGADVLQECATHQDAMQIRVDDQTSGQLLFASIAVL